MKKYILNNLDCPMCAAKIEAGIKDLSCVKDAKVVFATKTLLIDTDNIEKVQSTIDNIEKGVTLTENKKNEEQEFNVKKEIILLVILLIIQTIIFVYVASNKPYLHIDEGYSFGLTNYEKVEIMDNEDFFDTWHTKEYFEDYLAPHSYKSKIIY